MSQGDYSTGRGSGWFTGILFMLMGFFIMAMGLGVIHTDPSSIHAPAWLIGIFGGTFVISGLWVIFQRATRPDSTGAGWVNTLFLLLVMIAITIICLWIGFGPGERVFVQHEGLSNRPTAMFTDPTLGRIFFGMFGILMTGVTMAIAILQGRKLLARK